ncbi:MAG: hypothetical protein Q4B26_10330 [Eubacteriales bacterium]|nr:hypothetical protein [Eubacteriales bacterium]
MVKTVRRKRSRWAPILQGCMAGLAVLFLLMGVMFDRGFMLSCFLMTGLYFLYQNLSVKEFEYEMEGSSLVIDEIIGNKMRKTVLEADLGELIVCAPNDSARVDSYRRSAGSRIKKYDFTSRDPEIPYETMILRVDGEEQKFLVEMDEEMLTRMKQRYPDKVVRRG